MAGHSGLPSTDEMFEWIEEVVAQGIRRPGYPADRWTEQFIFDKFEELGLQSLRFEPVESVFWRDDHARLSIATPGQTVEVECFPVPLSEPTGIEGPLAIWDPADPAAVAGKVAMYELRFGSLPDEFPVLARRGVDADARSPDALVEAGWAFDPDHTFGEGRHRLPFAAELQGTMEPAIADNHQNDQHTQHDHCFGGDGTYRRSLKISSASRRLTSKLTQDLLRWTPTHPGFIEPLDAANGSGTTEQRLTM